VKDRLKGISKITALEESLTKKILLIVFVDDLWILLPSWSIRWVLINLLLVIGKVKA